MSEPRSNRAARAQWRSLAHLRRAVELSPEFARGDDDLAAPHKHAEFASIVGA
jgi:hypothetical protein